MLQKLQSTILRALNPDYSYCEKCKMPWNHVESKAVITRSDENGTSGTFATCKKCWDNSSLEELKQYYTNVYYRQEQSLRGNRWGYQMSHTLEHLLDCVEKEYNKTH